MSDLPAGNGPAMAGNNESTADAAATIAAGVAAALADYQGKERLAEAFIQQSGGDVGDGHATIEKPTGGNIG
jgi:hypothetical protein